MLNMHNVAVSVAVDVDAARARASQQRQCQGQCQGQCPSVPCVFTVCLCPVLSAPIDVPVPET